MTVTSKPLIVSKYASSSEATEYTANGLRTIIDKFTGYNGSGGAVTLTIKLVPNGGTAGASNITVTRAIAVGATDTFPEICGHSLEPGGFISVLASSATAIVIRSTGREVTGS